MIRQLIGIILVLTGFGLKTFYGHLILYWGIIETFSLIFFALGLTTLFFKFTNKLEKNIKGISFKQSPLLWILKGPLFVYLAIVVIIISLFWMSNNLNTKLKEYALEHSPVRTTAIFLGFEKQNYHTGRYSKSSKDFAIFRYKTKKGYITQGISVEELKQTKNSFPLENSKAYRSLSAQNQSKQIFKIIYAESNPTFFKIL